MLLNVLAWMQLDAETAVLVAIWLLHLLGMLQARRTHLLRHLEYQCVCRLL